MLHVFLPTKFAKGIRDPLKILLITISSLLAGDLHWRAYPFTLHHWASRTDSGVLQLDKYHWPKRSAYNDALGPQDQPTPSDVTPVCVICQCLCALSRYMGLGWGRKIRPSLLLRFDCLVVGKRKQIFPKWWFYGHESMVGSVKQQQLNKHTLLVLPPHVWEKLLGSLQLFKTFEGPVTFQVRSFSFLGRYIIVKHIYPHISTNSDLSDKLSNGDV